MLLIALGSTAPAAQGEECDIAGVWQHTTKAAQLFIDVNKGEISVYSHEINPESIGLVVLKSLKSNSMPSSWHASMYSAVQDSFVTVKITAKSCNQLSVSYHNEEVLGLQR